MSGDGGGGGERRAELVAAAGFAVCVIAALALAVVYRRGGQPQLEGALLAIALAGLGFGLVTWARRLLPHGEETEDRETLPTTGEERRQFQDTLEQDEVIGRRPLLTRMLMAATGALGLAALFPIRSLGPNPGDTLERTPWERGRRLVNGEGVPVRAADIPVDGLVTVFPDGEVGSADGQAVLVRVRPGLLGARPGREDWSPEGLIAFSKVCTHAGCPVGLYQADIHQLLCPCHQSAFDVLRGARPVFGPAARALPQLPLAIDQEGFVTALGDFSEPVGPAWWTRR
ncbi:MAG: Rieske (2Fe-2S) protein [Actinomycetota bacterium]|nr:Rieske (2Fe-2S) protein [Actinomycetota bacterium]